MTASSDPWTGLSTAIQPIGGLIACDAAGERVTHVSESIADIFGQTPGAILGISLEVILPRDIRHNLRNIMSLRRYKDGRHFLGRHLLPKSRCDASVSCSSLTDHVVFEFEPASEPRQSADDFAAELRHLSDELRLAESDSKLLDGLAGILRVATGYDSVMVYRFAPTGGEVVAEARNSTQQSWRGQRLPQLERLVDANADERMPIPHFTADAAAVRIPIHASGAAEPNGLDLFFCHMRGLTEAELAVASALNVRAAMTVPLIMNSGLWGMAVLLHKSPRTPSRYVRQLCDALASVVCDRMQILQYTMAPRPARIPSPAPERNAHAAGKTVMVIEDNRLVAADLKLTLLDLGFSAVDLFHDEASALEFLASQRIDMAVLDIHLDGDATSFAVARKLAKDQTPFIFLSGYGASTKLPTELGERLVTSKPATRRKLSAKIDELLDGATSPQAIQRK